MSIGFKSTREEIDRILTNVIFDKYSSEGTYDMYVARIHDLTKSPNGRFLFLVSPFGASPHEKIRSHQVPWACFQSRSMKVNKTLRAQQWLSPSGGVRFTRRKDGGYRCERGDAQLQFIGKTYPTIVTLGQAIDTFDCSIELTDGSTLDDEMEAIE